MVNSIFSLISKDCKHLKTKISMFSLFYISANVVIGKKRKAKIKQMLRQNILQGNGQPSSSAIQPSLSNLLKNMSQRSLKSSFEDALEEFDSPKKIEFASAGSFVILGDNSSVYTSSNCHTFDESVFSLADYWNLIMVSSLH